MSSIKIICPLGAAITDIGAASCFEDFGQIQRLGFQRIFSSGSTKNSFLPTGVGDIKLKASWDADLAANDGTKIQLTSEVEAPTFEVGAARTVGGGNASIGGVTKNIGSEPTKATFTLNAYSQAVIEQLKALMSERGLAVWLFNEFGQIGCLVDNRTTPGFYYPIPIAARTMFVSDKKIGGLEEEDSNMLTFSFLPNWSDKFVIITPTDFNPLTDLVN